MTFAKLIDTSHWNGPSPDLAKAKEMGVVGGIHRLGSINDVTGICYTDYRLEEYTDAYVKADLPLGYYWYTRPKWGGGRQIDFILETLQRLKLPMTLDFWIDEEEPGADVNGPGSAPFQARDAIRHMGQELLKAYPNRGGIYTSDYLWTQYVAADPFWPSLQLWAARWDTDISSPWSDGKAIFRDWTEWEMWQYSKGFTQATLYGFVGAPNGTADIDLDYWNGTPEEFKAEYTPDPLAELEDRLLDVEMQILEAGRFFKELKQTVTDLTALHNGELTQLAKRIAELEEWRGWRKP